jgi:hypothetical protein
MLRIFENARIARPHKRVWKDTRGYMGGNPGVPTQLLWRMAVFRLEKLTDAVGYRFTIEDIASSIFNCIAIVSPENRSDCIAAIKSLVDEEKRDPDKFRYSLAGELVWSLVSLVDLRLSGQRSTTALLGLIEAGFRGAACSLRDRRKSGSSSSEVQESRVRFQWSTLVEQQERANINLVLKSSSERDVSVTCVELPAFHARFSSIAEAKEDLPESLCRFLSERMGGPAMIWTPDGWD